jgi:hypothetical protein
MAGIASAERTAARRRNDFEVPLMIECPPDVW